MLNGIQSFLVLAPFAAVSSLVAFVVTLARRPRKITFLSHFLFGCFLIISGQLLELTSSSPDSILLFSHLTYGAIAILPVFWFLFSRELTRVWTKNRMLHLALLSVVPLTTLVIAWTNPFHHLLWKEQVFQQIGNLTVNVVTQYGPWFWVHCVYSYGLFLIGVFLIVQNYIQQHEFYQKQSLCTLAGAILPVALNLIYVFRLLGPMPKDFSPLVLALSGILFTIGVRKYSLGRVYPIPRRGLFEWLEDPIVILDEHKRIIDFNRVAKDVFSIQVDRILGNPLSVILPVAGGDFPSVADLSENIPVQWEHNGEVADGVLRVKKLTRDRDGEVIGYNVLVQLRTPQTVLPQRRATHQSISRKEKQVLALLTQDLTNKEIATKLGVTESTVKAHVHKLLTKAGVKRRQDLTL